MFMYWLLKFTLIPHSSINDPSNYSTVSFSNSNWQLGVARVENLMLVCTYELCNDISYLNLFSNFKHCFIWLRGCLKMKFTMNENKNLKSQWMKLCKRSRSKSRQIWVIDRDRDRDRDQESWINRDRDRDHKSAFDRDRDRDEKCDLTRFRESRSPPE